MQLRPRSCLGKSGSDRRYMLGRGERFIRAGWFFSCARFNGDLAKLIVDPSRLAASFDKPADNLLKAKQRALTFQFRSAGHIAAGQRRTMKESSCFRQRIRDRDFGLAQFASNTGSGSSKIKRH